MKKHVINTIAAAAGIAALLLTATAPGWVVWLILAPAIYAVALYLIKSNTNYITHE